MAIRHITTYICDWCRAESDEPGFPGNHLSTNYRHQFVNKWEICNGCFDLVAEHIDQIRTKVRRQS